MIHRAPASPSSIPNPIQTMTIINDPFRLPLLAAFAFLLSGCATFVEYGSETDFGVGVRGVLPMERVVSDDPGALVSRLELAGSFHRGWPAAGSWTEGNLDVFLPLFRLGGEDARSYVGTGLHVGRLNPDLGDSSTKVGANFIGGVRFQQRGFAPFVELRASAGGADQLSGVLGVQFLRGSF
jgi:hypothetical protein